MGQARARLLQSMVCAALVLAPVLATPVRGDAVSEGALKAAYLTKFVPFIEWPERVLAAPSTPVTICIVGEDPFGATLDKAAAAAAGGRKLSVRRIPEANAETGGLCHIVYVTDSQAGYDAVDALRNAPVVTVTDSSMRARGMINFVTLDNHVRFDIDEGWAERNGIHFSSKLLGVARSVKRAGGMP